MKKLLAVCLALAAIGMLAWRWSTLPAPPPPEQPRAVQVMNAYAEETDEEFERGIRLLGLSEENRTRFEAWRKWKPDGKSAEEKRAHRKELAEILTPEQIEEFKALEEDRTERRTVLKQAKDARLQRMLGEQDYKLWKEMQQKQAAEKKAKREAAKASTTPTPTPSPEANS